MARETRVGRVRARAGTSRRCGGLGGPQRRGEMGHLGPVLHAHAPVATGQGQEREGKLYAC
jgi:hypothetical protein